MQRYAGAPYSNHKTLTNDVVTSDSKRLTIKALGRKLDAVLA